MIQFCPHMVTEKRSKRTAPEHKSVKSYSSTITVLWRSDLNTTALCSLNVKKGTAPQTAAPNCQMDAPRASSPLRWSSQHRATGADVRDMPEAHLTCFRWHLNVFFLHLGDNRTFHLTITEPSKSSNPVLEHWWASLIGFCWQLDSIIHRDNFSSASVTVLDESRGYLVPGFLLFPATAPLLLLLRVPPGEGARHLDMFLRGYLRVCPLRRLGFTATNAGKVAEQPPSPVAAKSSLLHQQHGESRRGKENNRGNGATDAGFKPPLTTDKQHRPKCIKERRKTQNNGRGRGFGAEKRFLGRT